MKWALIVLGSLLGLIAIIALIGAMQPRDHVATMTATISAPADKVWAALTDVAAYPAWRTGLKSVDVLSTPGAPLSWRETTSQGPMTLTAEVFEPPKRMVARIKDEGQPFGGAWEYVVAPDSADAGKSRVTITERGWVSNPIFRFVSRFVMGHYSTLDTYLRELGRKFGADVTPARVSS
jgi:uncharacterized protein YndB with AHSA1/START domain